MTNDYEKAPEGSMRRAQQDAHEALVELLEVVATEIGIYKLLDFLVEVMEPEKCKKCWSKDWGTLGMCKYHTPIVCQMVWYRKAWFYVRKFFKFISHAR